MRNENKDLVWEEGDAVDAQSFVGYVQMFTDKTATILKGAS